MTPDRKAVRVTMDSPLDFGLVNQACVAQHELYSALRQSGFTRIEALYIITRSSVEMTRLEWCASHDDAGSPN